MTIITTAPTKYQLPGDFILYDNAFGIVAEYVSGCDLCGALVPVMPDSWKRDDSPLWQKVQKLVSDEFDRNLVIFWASLSKNNARAERLIRAILHEPLITPIIHQDPEFDEREYAFARDHLNISFEELSSKEFIQQSAPIIRKILSHRDSNMWRAFFGLIQHHYKRAEIAGAPQLLNNDEDQPTTLTLVVPEALKLFHSSLSFQGCNWLINQPIDLRNRGCYEIDIRESSLTRENLIVSNRTRVIADSGKYMVWPLDNLPSDICLCSRAIYALNEYRGSTSSLCARIGYTLCYLGLLIASLIEMLVRSIMSIICLPLALGLGMECCGCPDQAPIVFFEAAPLGVIGSALNALACIHALYANLATEKALEYTDLIFGLSQISLRYPRFC